MSPEPLDLETRLLGLVRSYPLLMHALRAAREVDPPDWLIGAGVLRDRVWAHLHGFSTPPPRDVDLAFYDPQADDDCDEAISRAVCARAPSLPWEVINEARVHLSYPHAPVMGVSPFVSSADAVAAWPETATAVAIRLTKHDHIDVVAPCGLEDLFGLVWRHNQRRASIETFNQRLQSKQIATRWPNARIVDPEGLQPLGAAGC